MSKESSPYLLQHASNPVDWFAWGDEALKKARNDGKPIFLSVGYSTCHWCHVMAHESFEDPATAAIMNGNFISIKVDREERPDLDAYYMNAVQAMTGQGGWPLSVFLTPDLRPFYGGTYFPPEPRYGMPSFVQVLEFVSKLWKDSRGEVVKNAEEIAKAIQEERPRTGGELSVSQLEDGYAALAASFDPEHGGFGRAPKFPLPSYMEFMLRYHFRTGKELALRTVTKTLDEMLTGGIRDHLGGGFHRYSTDRLWLVPHFEKMLYDNALLARVLLRAYKVTGNGAYSSAAREALKWMMSELASEGGGFFSAQDADTREGEGVFYTWTPQEVAKVIGPEASEAFCHVYGVTKNGNFEGGRCILHLSRPVEEAAVKFGTTREVIEQRLQGWRAELYEARLERPRPATDTKILTAWNGLAISALAEAGQTLGDGLYLEAAKRAARFILSENRSRGALLRKQQAGGAALAGTLEDYAFLVEGLVDLFEAAGEPEWLEESIKLSEAMVDLFWDREKGGFFMGTDPVPARVKDGHDGPTPSGNSVAALNLIRISEITGASNLRSVAEKTVRYFQTDAEEQPSEHTYLLASTDMLVNGLREVAVTARDPRAAAAMADGVRRKYLPDVVLVVAASGDYERLSKLTPLLEGRRPGPKPTAYVCQSFACKTPARTAEELAKQLGSTRG